MNAQTVALAIACVLLTSALTTYATLKILESKVKESAIGKLANSL